MSERDRIAAPALRPRLALGTLSVDDPDIRELATGRYTYAVSDDRFEVDSTGILYLKAGASLDFEAGQTVTFNIQAKDGMPGSLAAIGRSITIEIKNEDDVLVGGPGADILEGQKNRDILDGLERDDLLYGASGTDQLSGGFGDDLLNGGDGGDKLTGGSGSDTADYSVSGDGTLLIVGVTADLATPAGNTGFASGDSYDSIENPNGTGFADTLGGDGLANTLQGFGGDDRLFGRGGADKLKGGAGDDELVGGLAVDELEGEAGLDLLEGGEGGDILRGGDENDWL